jgi:rare lipoprotein A
MEIRRRSGVVSLITPLRIWLLAGITSIALVGVAVTLTIRTVHADVGISRPAAIVPPSVPAVPMAAPDSLTPTGTHPAKRKSLLKGIASWYGEEFDGRLTASGEPYDMNAMTACHPSLPFGSVVRVVNEHNGRSVIVRITDRSGLVKGRIIDLSYGAAEQLAMTKSGLARVTLEVLSRGAKPNEGQH